MRRKIVMEEYVELCNGYYRDDEVEIFIAPHSTVRSCIFKKVIIRRHPKYKIKDYVTYYPDVGYIPNAVFTQNYVLRFVSKEIPLQITWNYFAKDEEWANDSAISRQLFPKETV